MFYLLFFFSSRRRHTRYWRDWSSDVCSSDLPRRAPGLPAPEGPAGRLAGLPAGRPAGAARPPPPARRPPHRPDARRRAPHPRPRPGEAGTGRRVARGALAGGDPRARLLDHAPRIDPGDPEGRRPRPGRRPDCHPARQGPDHLEGGGNRPMTDKPVKKEKFEDYLRQVEETVKSLEGGKLGLEESIEKYETGVKALRQCYSILEQAERKIQLLVKEKDGSLTAKDFEPAGEERPA